MYGTLLKVLYDSKRVGRSGNRAPLGAYIRKVIQSGESKKIMVYNLPSLFTVIGSGAGSRKSLSDVSDMIGDKPPEAFLDIITRFKNRKMDDIYKMIEYWLKVAVTGDKSTGIDNTLMTGAIELPITQYQFSNYPNTVEQTFGALQFAMKALTFELLFAQRFIQTINLDMTSSGNSDELFQEIQVAQMLPTLKAMTSWGPGITLGRSTWQGAPTVLVTLDADKMATSKSISPADWTRWKSWVISYTTRA